MMVETIAMWVVCFALGLLIGYEVGHKKGEGCRVKGEDNDTHDDAPVPDFDVNNPINGRYAEAVEIDGHVFWRMN